MSRAQSVLTGAYFSRSAYKYKHSHVLPIGVARWAIDQRKIHVGTMLTLSSRCCTQNPKDEGCIAKLTSGHRACPAQIDL